VPASLGWRPGELELFGRDQAAEKACAVTFPPGRLRLATMPLSTGSPAAPNTIGIVVVAAFGRMSVFA
jgi:hypothetical protein